MIPFALTVFLIAGQGASPAPAVLSQQSAPPSFDLTIENGRVVFARAAGTQVVVIAKRLSEILKVPVNVTPELAKSRVTFRPLKNVSLAELLLQLTPGPLVDTREPWGGEPKLVAIHLGADLSAEAAGDPAPSGMLVEGNTDEDLVDDRQDPTAIQEPKARPSPSPSPTPADPKGPFLRVSKENGGRVTVRAREQGLGSVLFQIAQAYGVRFDMHVSEAPEVPSLFIYAALPSELPGILGPGSGLVVRRNIATAEERPLQFFLDPSA
ncbi:MAG: hypothetical protein ABI672_07460 [Vicinamibacteria bacterium]